MWEYMWLESVTDDAGRLTELGREGWEAVGLSPAQNHLGRTYVMVLLKRLAPARTGVVDVSDREPSAALQH
jgi:hypothetical protein